MNDLSMSRIVLATPAEVFRYWTDPEWLKQGWGPEGVICTETEIDLRVGGQYKIANRLPDGSTLWIHGKYEVIDPPNKLCYTWAVGLDTPPAERVTVTFRALAEGTEVTVLHEDAPNEATMLSHHRGWEGCLEGLAKLASSNN
jgi:uncharacterized protein YndB with AHSA1/START domain